MISFMKWKKTTELCLETICHITRLIYIWNHMPSTFCDKNKPLSAAFFLVASIVGMLHFLSSHGSDKQRLENLNTGIFIIVFFFRLTIIIINMIHVPTGLCMRICVLSIFLLPTMFAMSEIILKYKHSNVQRSGK